MLCVVGVPSGVGHVANGLSWLRHRGKDSCGVGFFQDREFNKIFSTDRAYNLEEKLENSFSGLTSAIGHTWYKTSKLDGVDGDCVQPFVFWSKFGYFALVHNGQLWNEKFLKRYLQDKGAKFSSDSDSEILGNLIAHSNKTSLKDAILSVIRNVIGAFSVLVLDENNNLYAFKDKANFRPLSFAEVAFEKDSRGYIFSSENYFFDKMFQKEGYEVSPSKEIGGGELISVVDSKLKKYFPAYGIDNHFVTVETPSFCSFEDIYFLSKNNKKNFEDVDVNSVGGLRKRFGRIIAKENEEYFRSLKQPVVVPSLYSGKSYAEGLSDFLGFCYEELIKVKDYHSERSFIEREGNRINYIKEKFEFDFLSMDSKDVIIVDDSIVRGNTSKTFVEIIRGNCTPSSITFVSGSPKVVDDCGYGINLKKDSLVALDGEFNVKENEDIAGSIGCDKVIYLDVKNLNNSNFSCTKCFGGKDPLEYVKKKFHREDYDLVLSSELNI